MYELLSIVAAASETIAPMSLAEMWAAIIKDFSNITEPDNMLVFLKVLAIDLVLAGDNAIIVGALAAGLPPDQRRKVIVIGVLAALVLRVAFALFVTQLLQITGIILLGGLLLVWVSYKMWRDLRYSSAAAATAAATAGAPSDSSLSSASDESDVTMKNEAGAESTEEKSTTGQKTFLGAVWAVAVADVSMSLDNVLAVAGAAHEHPGILIVGLILAVILMGVAANIIASYIERYRWIAYIGLAVIVWVAAKMIWDGWWDVHPLVLGFF